MRRAGWVRRAGRVRLAGRWRAVSAVVGVLVVVAVLALVGPAPRRAPTAGGSRGTGSPGSARAPVRRRGRRRAARGRPADADLAGLLHAVAAQVRAGTPPGAAWAGVLGSGVAGQVPDAAALAAAAGARVDGRVRAVVAGAHVAAETGAPLADVLADLADAVAADAEQAGEIEAALAGPRATARVLTLLPVLGLVVGAAMGARPWQVLLDGGLGSGAAVVGAGLVVTGRLWVAVLLRRAGAP